MLEVLGWKWFWRLTFEQSSRHPGQSHALSTTNYGINWTSALSKASKPDISFRVCNKLYDTLECWKKQALLTWIGLQKMQLFKLIKGARWTRYTCPKSTAEHGVGVITLTSLFVSLVAFRSFLMVLTVTNTARGVVKCIRVYALKKKNQKEVAVDANICVR